MEEARESKDGVLGLVGMMLTQIGASCVAERSGCWCSKRKRSLADDFGGDTRGTVRIRESVDERRSRAGT